MAKHHSTHWGWYWKLKLQHSPKKLCSDAFRIDVLELVRNLKLEKEERQVVRVEIGEKSFELVVLAERLLYTLRDPNDLTKGWRYWLYNPCCGKKSRFIYFLDKLGCRNCLDLAYWSQRLRPSRRFEAMRRKYEQNLIDRGGSIDKKPRRMHQTTWRILRQRVFEYERLFADALYRELLEYYPGLRRPRLNGFCGV